MFARTLLILIVALSCATGCASRRTASKSTAAPIAKASEATSAGKDAIESTPEVIATAFQLDSVPSDAMPPTIPGSESLPVPIDAPPPGTTPEEVAAPSAALELRDVVASVQANFPLIQAAMDERQIKSGEELASWGAFDHKLKAASETEPLGYYENYRHGIGVERDTMWGGKTVAGYRIGRGSFEPWYLERQTNEGGEDAARFCLVEYRNLVAHGIGTGCTHGMHSLWDECEYFAEESAKCKGGTAGTAESGK